MAFSAGLDERDGRGEEDGLKWRLEAMCRITAALCCTDKAFIYWLSRYINTVNARIQSSLCMFLKVTQKEKNYSLLMHKTLTSGIAWIIFYDVCNCLMSGRKNVSE
jgi:hypothetical protein